MVPHASGDGHDVHHAAHGGDPAADDRGQILVPLHGDARRVRRGRGFAHGTQVQPRPGAVQEEEHPGGQNQPQVEKHAVAEEDAPQGRDILKEIREGGVLEKALQCVADGNIAVFPDPHVLADELAHSCAEDGQGQSGDVLVGPEGDGEEAENQGGQGPRQEGAENADAHGDYSAGPGSRRLFVVEHAPQAQGAAHEHDALHAQVQVAGFLRQDFPQGAEEQGRAIGDGGDDEGQEQTQEITHAAPPSFPRRGKSACS